MATKSLVPLSGSERMAIPDARRVDEVDDAQQIDITLILKRREEIPRSLVEGSDTVSGTQLAERYGANPDDIDLICRTAQDRGLTVVKADQASRRVEIAGPLGRLRTVVDPGRLTWVKSTDPITGKATEHRQREGTLRILPEWKGIVSAVLGFDDRPQARPHVHRGDAGSEGISYSPAELGRLYQFPPGTDGTGRTIALVELGGGFDQENLMSYFADLGVPTRPSVTAVGVGHGQNAPDGRPDGDDGEVQLDIEVAGALAPGAQQIVYFGENNDKGFVDAVSAAVYADPPPTALSISWGKPEDAWSPQARDAMDAVFADAAALGVTVCVAAGDHGASDGVPDGRPHPDFPATSPHALACGGTRLEADPRTGAIDSETVWNDGQGWASGGGYSTAFEQPSWQAAAGNSDGVTGWRGIPDVAGDADGDTGYEVRIDGEDTALGGTSAVAPLWAALAARLSESKNRPLGLMQPQLYAGITPGGSVPGFRDITEGDIGDYGAAPGWDACTGLGVPVGAELVSRV